MSNTVKTDLVEYYAKSTTEYEQMYAKPERQSELFLLQERTRELLQGHRVLELACGTGYWTAQYADVVEVARATDINPDMLSVAVGKGLPLDKVEFAVADAWNTGPQPGFNACFAGFLWSHVKREDQDRFLQNLRETLGKEALLVLIDDTYVEGISTPIARTDAAGNTYQIHTLANGERYEIVKNFPTDSTLRKRLAPALRDMRIMRLNQYWLLSGKFK